MAPKLSWFLVSERVIFDQESSNVSIINCLDQIGTDRFPAFMQQIALSAAWFREDPADATAYHIHVRLWTDAPERERQVLGDVELEMNRSRVRLRAPVYGVVFERPGVYWFGIDTKVDDGKWHEAGRQPLVAIQQVLKGTS